MSIPDHAEAYTLTFQFRQFRFQKTDEQLEEEFHFLRRAVEVFPREGVYRHIRNTERTAACKQRAHRIHAASMPFTAGEAAPLRPSTVTVHDDGEVSR